MRILSATRYVTRENSGCFLAKKLQIAKIPCIFPDEQGILPGDNWRYDYIHRHNTTAPYKGLLCYGA